MSKQGRSLKWEKAADRFIDTFIHPVAQVIPADFRHKARAVVNRVLGIHRPVTDFEAPQPWKKHKFPKGVNLVGLYRMEIGLSQGIKLMAAAADTTDMPHTLVNVDRYTELCGGADHSYDDRLRTDARYGVNVVHLGPDIWRDMWSMTPEENWDYHYNIGIWMWELEKMPEQWRYCFKYVDELWAPSQFVVDVMKKETDKPVKLIPYGITAPWDEKLTRKDFGLPEDGFLVLCMFDSASFASRKNPIGAIRAFREAFSGSKNNAHMVIKVNFPKEEDVAAIREAIGDLPYTLITERMSKERVNTLIRLCDVFISLHRSEGFGLVMAEAMLLGTAVVSTNWSANVEFMPPETACMVDYKLIPVDGQYPNTAPGDGNCWADADVHQAAGYLKRLYEDEAFRNEKIANGQNYIKTHYSPEVSGEAIKKRINEIYRGIK